MRFPRWASATALVPVLFGTAMFIVAAVILPLVGAFFLRLLTGVSAYRSSAVWAGVVSASLILAVVLGVVSGRRFAAGVFPGVKGDNDGSWWSSDDLPASSRPATQDPNAVASLVLGVLAIPLYAVVPLGICAVLLGSVTWRRRRAAGLPDSRIVTAALILGALSLGGVVVEYTSLAITIGTEDGISGDELRPGDCWKVAEGPGPVVQQDCAGRHRYEVFAVIDDPSPPGAPYPGVEPLQARGKAACEGLFQQYAGRPLGGSNLEVIASVPTSTRWNEGNRRLRCSVGRPNGSAKAGSVKESP